ncbi:MAG: hypothetical protein AVDCRST_MAG02-2759, partial [uncultured Rubrobacteraceae bacterium]
ASVVRPPSPAGPDRPSLGSHNRSRPALAAAARRAPAAPEPARFAGRSPRPRKGPDRPRPRSLPGISSLSSSTSSLRSLFQTVTAGGGLHDCLPSLL